MTRANGSVASRITGRRHAKPNLGLQHHAAGRTARRFDARSSSDERVFQVDAGTAPATQGVRTDATPEASGVAPGPFSQGNRGAC